MSVLPEVDAAGDVDPPAGADMLQDQLVVVHVVLHPHEQQTGDLLLRGIAPGPVLTGDGDVGGLALHVL